MNFRILVNDGPCINCNKILCLLYMGVVPLAIFHLSSNGLKLLSTSRLKNTK